MRSRKSRRLNKKNSKFTLQKSKSKSKIFNHYHKPTPTNHQDKPKRLYKQELDKSDVIEGLAHVIYDYVQRYDQLLKPRYQGTHFPGPRLFNSPEMISESPSLHQIQTFIQSIYDKRYMLHAESGIIALILLNRTNIKIHSQNWMRMVLISLLLANKHCEDVYSVFNAKFVGLIPRLENLEINILELEFLKFLKYRLHIETETYDHYYAKLQEFFPIEEPEVEQNMPNEEEMVQSMSSEMETIPEEAETTTSNGYGQCCHLIHGSSDTSWQDSNFALVDSIA